MLAQPGAPGADTGAISSTSAQKAGEWSGRTRWQTSWATTWSATASGASSSRQENDRRPVEPQLPQRLRGSRIATAATLTPSRAATARPPPERAPRLLPVPPLDDPVEIAGRRERDGQASPFPAHGRAAGPAAHRQLQLLVEQRHAVAVGQRRRGGEQRLLLGDPSLRRPQEPVHLCGARRPRNGQADAGSGHPQRHAACAAVPHDAQPKGRSRGAMGSQAIGAR